MERTLVLSADKWRMTDEKTGEIREGVSVQYVTDYRDESASAVGYRPLKVQAIAEVFEAIKKGGAPGLYDLDMRTRPGREGQTTVMAVRASHIRKVSLFDQAQAQSQASQAPATAKQ